MTRTLIVVADDARARFFRPELVPRSLTGDVCRLQELAGLVNPEGELKGTELFSEARSGQIRAPRGPNFGYDDRREGHFREIERRFVREVVRMTAQLLQRQFAEELILVVAPRLLGVLRGPIAAVVPAGVRVTELAAEMSAQAPERIREFLLRRGSASVASP
jgi:hypothetical protein